MIRPDDNYIHSEITDKIIGCAYDVYNQLGFGFAEKVYENAMMIKLPQKGLEVVQQTPINLYFEGNLVGEYFADILVNSKVILELKAVSSLSKAHEVQLVNYLKATGIKVGLLINFGEKLKITRRVFKSYTISVNLCQKCLQFSSITSPIKSRKAKTS
jgi:GxxExxY protein